MLKSGVLHAAFAFFAESLQNIWNKLVGVVFPIIAIADFVDKDLEFIWKPCLE